MEKIKQKYKKVLKYLSNQRDEILEIIKQKYKKALKYLKSLQDEILLKNSKKTNNTIKKNIKLNISNFNKYIIGIIGLVFIYLFYLSIPTLYEKTWLQNTIEKKLKQEFKINFSISSTVTYEILPSPHFLIKDTKILNNNIDNPKSLSQIKKLKVFISQKNLFNKKNLKINKILIDDANFSIQEGDFKFFTDYLDQQFSKKKMKIRNSNIFYKDMNEEIISIIKLSNLSLFYDDLKYLNKVNLKGEIFKIPFTFKINKNFINTSYTTLINSKKLKLIFKNKSIKEGKSINGLNELTILNSKLISEYSIKDKIFLFKSKNSQLINNKIDYKGQLNLYPFNLDLNIDLEKINLEKILDINSIFFELIKSRRLFNENLSTAITLNSKNLARNKLFESLTIFYNQKNGLINLNRSQFLTKDISILTIKESGLNFNNDNLIFNGDFHLQLLNQRKFFNFFQIPKKARIPIKDLSFNLDYDILNDRLKINSIKIPNILAENEIENLLNNFNRSEDNLIKNLIKFKVFVNQIFSINYDG